MTRGGKSTGTGSGALSDFGFTGHYFDRPTGEDLTWWRAYDPSLGRWLSADPSGLLGGLNPYGYVDGDPVGSVDASGLGVVDCAAALAEYNRLKGRLEERKKENAANPDKGHDKAIAQLQNAVDRAADKVRKYCKDGETLLQVTIGCGIVILILVVPGAAPIPI